MDIMKIKDFNKKTVYVVGGSSGIGLSAAKLLAEEGADIVIFSRSREKLETAVGEISAAGNRGDQRIEYRSLDITNNKEVVRVVNEVVKQFGPPDILLNCAGKAHPEYFEKISYEQFDDIMKTNLYGVWNTVSACVPHMKKKGGYIVNTSSSLMIAPIIGYTDYSASKTGIIGFSDALRNELKPDGIGVSVLLPSDTDTPGFKTENETKPYETKILSEWGTLKSPEFVAKTLIRGIRKGRFLIIPIFIERVVFRLKEIVPGLLRAIFDGNLKTARKKMRSEK